MNSNPLKIPKGDLLKVILSRKGFDSSYGGCPSPILPDGTLLSLPIPDMNFSRDLRSEKERLDWKTWNNDQYHPLTYSDLLLPQSVKDYFSSKNLQFSTYRDILNEILPNGKLKQTKMKYSNNLEWTCHFDPDLIPSVLSRPPEWCSLFGQGGSAESHLKNQNVGNDDLFLFFGWFRKTELKNGSLLFDEKDKTGIHLIYGYLQVDFKISYLENRDKVETWMNYHPHLRLKAWNNKQNAIYVSRKSLSWNKNLSGASVFHYHPNKILTDTTKQNNPKCKKTHWKYDLFPEDLEITYHSNKSHRIEKNENGKIRKYFKSADRGQEFVISDTTKIIDWVKSLISLNNRVS